LNKLINHSYTISLILTTISYVCYPQNIDIAKMSAFADELCSDGDYNGASIEYRRVMYYDPTSIDTVLTKLADCYYFNSQYSLAIQSYQKAFERVSDVQKKKYCKFQLSKCYYENNQANKAIEMLMTLVDEESNVYHDASKYFLGYIFAHQYNWKQSSYWLSQVNSEKPPYQNANDLSKRILDGHSLQRKNPLIAGILAALPGAGYLYSGHTKIAIASVILNSLFLFGAYESFRGGTYTVGATFLIIGSGWYLGNIYGSMNKAKQYNKSRRDQFVYSLEFSL